MGRNRKSCAGRVNSGLAGRSSEDEETDLLTDATFVSVCFIRELKQLEFHEDECGDGRGEGGGEERQRVQSEARRRRASGHGGVGWGRGGSGGGSSGGVRSDGGG
eukprot:6201108-Pleurochrysis_carterae.AAC.3